MPVFINKPEFALKRAEEFLDVGKRVRALEALTEAIKNRKHRIWQKSHEDIMRKFIQLCVDLKQSQTAKEGLHQYKNLTANVNPKSLEDIIRYYLKLSETKCDEAREKANAQAAPVVDVDDLDLAETPENMLLKVVSTDSTQDRADRVVLLPWVRFNWEAYRHCLDLLRNLSKLETLYHDIASQAFKFCLKYVRKTELRKLCEMLRNHIGQISKREVVTANAVNLNSPETQELNLRTRLVQLDHAIAMEMWQEAFRAIEDVHGLMSMLKKVPKAALKANYFEKLALVFLRAGNAVFHAAAQHQLFSLYRNFRKDLVPEELRKLAVAVLFATLAVPLQPPRTHLESLLEYDETAASKMKQLTLLVGYNQAPSRTKLVEDLQKLGILQHIRPELHRLYHFLEVAFDPLHMGSQVAEVLNFVKTTDDLAGVRHYVKVIEEVAVGKQLRQLSQAYDSIEIDRVIVLMPYTDWHTIERVAIETARNTDLEVRIDHRRPGLFVFGSEVALAPYDSQMNDGTETQIPTDRVRSQLVMLLTSLTRTSRAIKSQNDMDEETHIRQQLFTLYRKNSYRDHMSNLQRSTKTDNRQKYLEEREKQKEQQAQAALKTKEKESAAAENLRMQRDTKQFDEQRSKQKEKELEKQVIREKIEKLKQTEFGMRVLKELNDVDLENIDVKELDRLELRHREELKREEEENNIRLKLQEKKIDHTVRAKHMEEVPLRVEDNKRMIEVFKEVWARDETQMIQLLRESRELALMKKRKMERMKEEKQKFMDQVRERKKQAYDEKMAAWEKTYAEEKAKRLEDRRIGRERDRRETWERIRREEEAQRIAAEEFQRQEQEKETKRKEDEERKRKQDEMAAKQREREREIEEKLAARQREANEAEKYKSRTAAPPMMRPVVATVAARSIEPAWRSGTTAPTVAVAAAAAVAAPEMPPPNIADSSASDRFASLRGDKSGFDNNDRGRERNDERGGARGGFDQRGGGNRGGDFEFRRPDPGPPREEFRRPDEGHGPPPPRNFGDRENRERTYDDGRRGFGGNRDSDRDREGPARGPDRQVNFANLARTGAPAPARTDIPSTTSWRREN